MQSKCLICAVIAAMAAMIWGAVPATAADNGLARVFFLNSYHNGYDWSDNILAGLREVLEEAEVEVELHVEYMDVKKFPSPEVRLELLNLYREKYAQEDFDVVVASDNAAFDFLLKHRAELFPDVPLVFAGVNDFHPSSIKGLNATGVLENVDIAATLDLAIKFHPERRRFIVIGDDSETNDAIRRQIQAALPPFAGRIDAEFWEFTELEEIKDRMRAVEDQAIFYAIPFFRKIDGRYSQAAGRIVEMLSRDSEAPFYSNWRFLLGKGIVGGSLLSGVKHGRMAGIMVLRILDGERAGTIQVLSRPFGEPAFDYRVLEKFGINMAKIPEGSLIVNEPRAFYELDKQVLWTILVAMAVLVLGLFFLLMNIARRRAVERRLRDQLSFQEILMDTIPQLICWKDDKQRYLGANRAFAEFFGISGPVSPDKPIDETRMPDKDFVKLADSWDKEVVETESPLYRMRTRTVNASGEQAMLEINKVPIYDQSGRVVGTLTTADDVTREANLERQLLQSQKMEAIGTLAGGIAHDFNNILTSIINSTEMASWDVDPETSTGKDLARVLKAAHRGSGLVKQILAFSRPSKEGIQPTDLSEVVNEALGLLKSSLPGNIRVSEDVDSELPKCPADPTQVNQVLMNLCTNAYQAMQDKGGRIEIGLSGVSLSGAQAAERNLAPGSYAALSVTDNGPGIPPRIMDKIFDPFFTTKGKTEGTGLGLAVVMGIAKAHHGAVTVESRQGEMTRFTVYLPLTRTEEVPETITEDSSFEVGGRILFVEDDQDQIDTVPRILERLGYRVTPCMNAMCAVDAVSSRPESFDVVVTDFDMPVTDGIELARILYDMEPNLPVVMVSGRDRAADSGEVPNIKKTVLKPYSGQSLSVVIREVIFETGEKEYEVQG